MKDGRKEGGREAFQFNSVFKVLGGGGNALAAAVGETQSVQWLCKKQPTKKSYNRRNEKKEN